MVNQLRVLEEPSQSPDLKLTEKLWYNLNIVRHKLYPTNLYDLKQFCHDEWAKIPVGATGWMLHTR